MGRKGKKGSGRNKRKRGRSRSTGTEQAEDAPPSVALCSRCYVKAGLEDGVSEGARHRSCAACGGVLAVGVRVSIEALEAARMVSGRPVDGQPRI